MVRPAPTTHQLSGAELIAATEDHLSRLDVLCNECEQLFGVSQFAAHNVLGPINVKS